MTDQTSRLEVSAKDVSDILSCDFESGVLTRRVSAGGRSVGQPVGSLSNQGYVRVTINRKTYAAHRIVWLLFYGEWPKNEVDHINGDRADNRICNLRAASRSQNGQNTKKGTRNSTGYKGVNFHRKEGKYRANIKVEGRIVHLGYFLTPEAAHEAYKSAAAQHFGEFYNAG